MRVGFVGAGAMGMPMVERLVAGGHLVAVYARRDETRAKVAATGAALVDTAAAVAGGAEVVALCPFTDEQVAEIAFADGVLAAMPSGSVLVTHTTGSPRTAQRLQAEAPPGVGVVDCPVSGGPGDIAAGHITLFAGGAAAHVNAAAGALATYGDPIIHTGQLGSGQAVKLLNNGLFAAQLQLAADAARLARDLGADPAAVAEAVGHGSGASRAIAILGGDAGRLAGLAHYLDKDVAVLRAVAAELGLDLGLIDATISNGPAPFG